MDAAGSAIQARRPDCRAKVDDEDLIAQTGIVTALAPVEIAEAWYNAAMVGFSRSRSTNNINGRITVYTTLRKNSADPPESVKMTADRKKPEEKDHQDHH